MFLERVDAFVLAEVLEIPPFLFVVKILGFDEGEFRAFEHGPQVEIEIRGACADEPLAVAEPMLVQEILHLLCVVRDVGDVDEEVRLDSAELVRREWCAEFDVQVLEPATQQLEVAGAVVLSFNSLSSFIPLISSTSLSIPFCRLLIFQRVIS